MDSLAFSLKTLPGEPGEFSGIVRVDDDEVIVEWAKAGNFYPRKKKVEELRIPFPQLESAFFKRGWFKSHLTIRPRKMTMAGQVPGVHHAGELNLHIHRSHRDAAQSFTTLLDVKISQAKLDNLDKELGL